MSESNDWKTCPKGELHALADSVRRDDRRQALRRIGGASVAVVLVGGGIYAVSSTATDPAGGLTCAEVRPLLPAYVNGGLTAKAKQQVKQHLAKCAHCREKHEEALL